MQTVFAPLFIHKGDIFECTVRCNPQVSCALHVLWLWFFPPTTKINNLWQRGQIWWYSCNEKWNLLWLRDIQCYFFWLLNHKMNYQKCVLTKQASDCLHSGDFVHNAMMAYPLQIKKRKKMFSDFVQDDNSVQYLKKKKDTSRYHSPKKHKNNLCCHSNSKLYCHKLGHFIGLFITYI